MLHSRSQASFPTEFARMKFRFSLVQTALRALGFTTLLLGACGGRYQTIVEDDAASGRSSGGGPSAGRGGSVSSLAGSGVGGSGIAGSASAGASIGGTSMGGASSAGASSSAGSGGGTDCRMMKCSNPTKCLGGQEPIPVPGQCCVTKCSACPLCPSLNCPAGYHLETAASDCCPHCAPDNNVGFCQKGQQEYALQREQMVEKYSYGCASSSECVMVAPVNACEQGCSYAAVWYGISDSFEANLLNLADMNCSTCMKMPIPPCAPPSAPSCVNGRCTSQ